MLHIVLATLLGAAGIYSLHTAWNARLPHWHPREIGWALLLSSGVAWTQGAGVEFGITLLFLVPPLTAWLLIVRDTQWRTPPQRKRTTRESALPASPTRWLHHSVLLLITVPLSGAAAIYVSIGVASLLPASALTRMTVAVLSMPVLWGCAACWAGSDERLIRPALGIAALGLAGAGLAQVMAS